MEPDLQFEVPGVKAALVAWRRKAGNIFLLLAAALHLPVIALIFIGYGPPLSHTMKTLGVLVYVIAVFAAVARPLHYRIRLCMLFVSAYLLAAVLNIFLPRGPYAQLGLFTLPVLVLVFLGAQQAKIATVLNLLIVVLAPLLRSVPAVARVFAMTPEQSAPGVTWMQVCTQIALLLGTMVLLLRFQRFAVRALTDQYQLALNETHRLRLETAFLHDLMSTASVLRAAAWLLETGVQGNGEVHCINALSTRLMDEIVSHRELVAAEHDLEVAVNVVNPQDLLAAVVETYNGAEFLNGRSLRIDPSSTVTAIESDPALLARVIDNMVKNAIEGSAPGDVITLGCRDAGNSVEFWVHNPTIIPENVRAGIFHKSFSTKGAGRGLGTYSMKLLTEKYLSGTITFRSEEGKGTTFVATYPVHPKARMAATA